MDDSFHLLSMINHMIYCAEKINGTAERYRPYLGTAQSIGLPERSRWCQPERDCGRMPHRGRIFNVHFEPYEEKKT